MRWPRRTFSLRPCRVSLLQPRAASVSTLEVSWNDAPERNESLDRAALEMPSRRVSPVAGLHLTALGASLPSASRAATMSLSSDLRTTVPALRLESQGSLILTDLAMRSFSERKRYLSTCSWGS